MSERAARDDAARHDGAAPPQGAPRRLDGGRPRLPSPGPDEISLLELLRVLWRRKALLITVPVVAVTLASAIAGLLPKIYEARAVLMFDPLSAGEFIDARQIDETMVRSEVEVLRSRKLAADVVAALGLDADPSFAAKTGGVLDGIKTRLLAAISPALADGEDPTPPRARTDPVERLTAGLTVERQGGGQVIAVAFRSADPVRAAEIANAVVDRYLGAQIDRRSEFDRRIADWLDARVAESRRRLDEARAALDAHGAGIAARPAAGESAAADKISRLEGDLLDATLERRAGETRLARLRGAMAADGAPGLSGEIAKSPALAQLQVLKDAASRRHKELTATFGERHPRILEANREIEAIESRIMEEAALLLRDLESEIGIAQARERAIGRELERLKGEASEGRLADARLEALQREVEIAGRIHASFLERAEARADTSGLRHADARLISEAVPPTRPSFPDPRVIVTVTLTVSLVIALIAVYLAELAEPGFRTNEEVEAQLGLHALGMLPMLRRRKTDPLPQDYIVDKPNSRFAESLRGVIATVQQQAIPRPVDPRAAAGARAGGTDETQGEAQERTRDGGGRVVMVNSALPGEGKTTIALSLARVAAQEGLRTLLIDADFRRPSLARLLGNGRPLAGLAEVLRGELSLYDTARPDPSTPLWYLAGNERLTQPTQLLGAEGIGRLLEEARATCDLVIIDTAPLLAVSDARLIAPSCDMVLFVARWQETARGLVSESIRTLRDGGAPFLAVLLNQVDLRRLASYGHAASAIASARLQTYYAD